MPFGKLDTPIIRPVAGGDEPVLDPQGNVHGNSSDLANEDNRSWWEKVVNGLQGYFNFGSGGPVAGNSPGATNIGTNVPGAGSSPGLDHDTVNEIVEDLTGVYPDPAGPSSGSSAKSGDQIDLSQFFNSAKDTSGIDLLKYLYDQTGDNGFLELLATTMINRENTQSARDWEENMSNTSFSRLINDIKQSGYNPWLALQNGNFGQASSYSTGSASSGSASVSNSARSAAVSEDNARNNVKASNWRTYLALGLMLMMKLGAAVFA